MVKLIKARLLYLWYSILLWWDDFGTDARVSRLPLGGEAQPTQTRRNDKLARGVRHLVVWLRNLTPEERKKLIQTDENILMKAGMSRKKSLLEKMEEARAMAKYNAGPRKEGEEAMAEMFVKNQGKYKLQLKLRNLHKEARLCQRPIKDIQSDINQVKLELKKYE